MSENKVIGALWSKKTKNGMEYMSGVVEIGGEKVRMVVFPARKKTDKSPDWNILLSTPQKEGQNSQKTWDTEEDTPF